MLLNGADAVEAARHLRHSADMILVERCDCFRDRMASFANRALSNLSLGGIDWNKHLQGCRGVQESGDLVRIALNIETQIMRKARWHARKEAK